MKQILLLIFGYAILTGCSSKEAEISACGVNNPIENLVWLKKQAYNSSYLTTISIATYKGQTVFFNTYCCHFCDLGPVSVINCSGQAVGTLGGQIPESELKNIKIIWQKKSGGC
jgi:hypothetical protein